VGILSYFKFFIELNLFLMFVSNRIMSNAIITINIIIVVTASVFIVLLFPKRRTSIVV